MLIPCKKLFYAVEAVLYIAYNATSQPVSSREIAGQQGLPPRYLEQIMQKLVHGGVLRGVRGPKGGYVLARERSDITVGEICQLLEDDEIVADTKTTSTQIGDEVVRPIWEQLCENMMAELMEVRIHELCQKAVAQNIPRKTSEAVDFTS